MIFYRKTLPVLAFAALMSAAGFLSAAPNFEAFMKKAEEADTLEQRLDNWKLAAGATKDEKKLLELCDNAIRLARKIGMNGDVLFFTKLKKDLSLLTSEQKTQAEFDYLVALEKPNNPPRAGSSKKKSKFRYENYIEPWVEPKDTSGEPTLADRWIEFLKRPNLTQKDKMAAWRKIGDFYQKLGDQEKMFKAWDTLLTYPLADYERLDLLLKCADNKLAHLDADAAIRYLNKILEMKRLSAARHGEVNLRMIRAKSKGYGFYYKADKKTQEEINKLCYDTMKLKDPAAYRKALTMLIDAARRVNDNTKVIELAEKYGTEENSLLDKETWASIKHNHARALRDTNHLDEAVEILEKLWKYKIDYANMCMELGYTYYLHGDYMEAVSMYDEA